MRAFDKLAAHATVAFSAKGREVLNVVRTTTGYGRHVLKLCDSRTAASEALIRLPVVLERAVARRASPLGTGLVGYHFALGCLLVLCLPL